jgi:hypothetical protein
MKQKTDSVKCVRDIREYPPSAYRLPRDGRKWQILCRNRREMAIQLSTYADGDGSRIFVGVNKLMQKLEWSRATIFNRLDDLAELGLLVTKGRNRQRGTALRYLNIAALESNVRGQESSIDDALESSVGDTKSPALEVSESNVRASKSNVGLDTTDTNRHTHRPLQTESVVVVVSDGQRSHVADELQARFVDRFGFAPGNISQKHFDAFDKLSAAYGRERFLAAGDAWMNHGPWNEKTTTHFAKFVTGFASYLALADQSSSMEHLKKSKEIPQEEQDAALAQYVEAHNKLWAIPAPVESEDDDGSCLFEEPATPDGSNEEKQR